MNVDTVIWFRRDLRIHDNPVFQSVLEFDVSGFTAVIVLNPDYFCSTQHGLAQRKARLASVYAFQEQFEREFGKLNLFCGRPDEIIPAFITATRAKRIVFGQDVDPEASVMDGRVTRLLRRFGVDVLEVNNQTVVDLDELSYECVDQPDFVEFAKQYSRFRKRGITDAPVVAACRRRYVSVRDDVLSLQRTMAKDVIACVGNVSHEEIQMRSETTGLQRFDSAANLESEVQVPSLEALMDTSPRWSFYVASGCLSARRLYEDMSRVEQAYAKRITEQLIQRDFCYAFFHRHPAWMEQAFQTVATDDSHSNCVRALFSGQTGYPIIDAALRQLITTGTLSDCLQQLVRSFTNQLAIDWHMVEHLFSHHLVDYDAPFHLGRWQQRGVLGGMDAPSGTGMDPFDMGKKFDPDGEYIRQYVPELSNVPTDYIYEPWNLPSDAAEAIRFTFGVTYPRPGIGWILSSVTSDLSNDKG